MPNDPSQVGAYGVNPFGRLAGLRIFNDFGSYDIARCSNSNAGVIDKAYRSGARISSNSWGAPRNSAYDVDSQAYDVGTRDALRQTAGNQELLFVFAAGNQGPGNGTIGSPATAKNVVTVGASENPRPDGTDGCGVGPTGADNADQIIGFSSRGPAKGSRIKPEIVAPGSHVQGTASTNSRFTGRSVCDQYWPAGQTVFARSSGTSHSAPAISGALSLYYHWLQTHFLRATPSPALLKAYLLAHTAYLTGTGAGDTLPSNNQGYGMPDLQMGLDNTSRFLLDQSKRFDKSGEVWSTILGTDDLARPFKVVLVWTDAPGSLAAAPQVNDLDLEVIADGETYLGNHYSGQWSTPGGSADRNNNTEIVSLPLGAESEIQIRVLARNIAGDGVPGVGDATDQDFALVVYNGNDAPSFRLNLEQSSTGICASGSTVIPLSIGQIKGFTSPVTLSMQGLPAGITARFDPPVVTPPGKADLNLDVAPDTPTTDYALQVLASSGALTRTQTLQFYVDHTLYAAFLKEPANEATSVSPTALLSWWAIPGARSYQLQVGPDAGFGVPIIDRSLAGTSLTTEILASAQTYYWRVRGQNACGDASFGEVRSFKTATLTSLSVSCSGLPRAVPDNDPTGVTCNLDVPDGFVAHDVTLDIDITHTYRGDLRLELTSPQGTTAHLKDSSIEDNVPNLAGNYDRTLTPIGPGDMSSFDGQTAGGTWKLVISDNFSQDIGQIQTARLNFDGFVPEAPPKVPIVGWLGVSLATALAGWLCQRSARSSSRRRKPRST